MNFIKNIIGYALLLFGVSFGILIFLPLAAFTFISIVVSIQSLDKGSDLIL